MRLKELIRKYLWQILGVDYNHILKVIDYVYLKEDRYTKIGRKSYSNNALVFRWSDAPIIIGNYCSIGDNVRFIVDQGKHHSNSATSYPFQSYEVGTKSGITIGNDVWIGQQVIILPGVKIGNGVSVAAGSVITKDVPDYCIIGGIPAEVIKFKCTKEEAAKMNELAWWNMPDDKVTSLVQDLQLPISLFLKVFSK